MKTPEGRCGLFSGGRGARRRGAALFAVLAVFAAVGTLSGYLALLSTLDVRMVANLRNAAEAFNEADAGLQYVKGRIDADLTSGALVLDQDVETVNYAAPTGMLFDAVTRLDRLVEGTYLYRVTGRSQDARRTLEAVLQTESLFHTLGLFGNESVDLKASSSILCYDSRLGSGPSASNSPCAGDVGSNVRVQTHQNTFIDGSILLGETAGGADAVWVETPSGGSTVLGDKNVPVDRVNPDPLGAVGGALASAFTLYSAAAQNDNDSAVPPISHDRIRLGNGDAMTLRAGNYYLTEIDLKNGSSLNVDASAGRVSIYLTGSMTANNGATINVNGTPRDFRVFSNSSEGVDLKNSSAFKGLLYAPYADVTVFNSGDFYGVAWGNNLEIKNSGNANVDAALLEDFPSGTMRMLSWKEVRR